MIGLDGVTSTITRLQRNDLERWIVNQWVRPDGSFGHYIFHDIDVERIRLIVYLRDDLSVNEEALPVVLSLLDQLYELRRRLNSSVD